MTATPSPIPAETPRSTPGTPDEVPRPRAAQAWRDTLDDYRLPAGPDGWWSIGHTG